MDFKIGDMVDYQDGYHDGIYQVIAIEGDRATLERYTGDPRAREMGNLTVSVSKLKLHPTLNTSDPASLSEQ